MSSQCTTPRWKHLRTVSFADIVVKWAGQNFGEFPWRRNRTPYETLVAELLLKRTTARAVSRIYETFLVRFPRLQEIEAVSEEELVEYLSGVGLQRQRARSFKRLATWLLATCGGDVPHDLKSLLEVPGLGDYSAAAILSFGYGIPIAVLDANVERVITRVFGNSLPPRPSKAMLDEAAQRLLPSHNHREYNYGLLDLGRLVCRYADARCNVCPLNSICDLWANSGAENAGVGLRNPSGKTQSKLKIARQHAGLSLMRLAGLAGVSKLTIIRIESGKTSPRHETLGKLAIALQVGSDELVD